VALGHISHGIGTVVGRNLGGEVFRPPLPPSRIRLRLASAACSLMGASSLSRAGTADSGASFARSLTDSSQRAWSACLSSSRMRAETWECRPRMLGTSWPRRSSATISRMTQNLRVLAGEMRSDAHSIDELPATLAQLVEMIDNADEIRLDELITICNQTVVPPSRPSPRS
jgi:hypothetical protein